ncbi:TetR family transcriptional regulator [Gordonia sp. SID5947]|nr:TetR/AcrR family transcriptional regulator [Gordonia sp. SID5947]MYR08238.1 TetR family transcriptional regulator [Gordonia sp. SID5947]
MNSSKVWGGRTLHDRSSDRRELLLAAAADLLGTGGAAAVTMRAVVREAGISPRYFYESFDSRETLLVAVYDRVEADLLDRLTAVDISRGLRDVVRSAFEVLRDFFQEDPRRARILLREPLADDVLRAHSASRIPMFTRAIVPMLAPDTGLDAADVDEDGDWAVRSTALSGALVAMYLEYTDGHFAVGPERIVDIAVDVVFAFTGLGS